MFTINLDRLREQCKNKFRHERELFLKELDVEFMRALESDNTTLKLNVVAKKNALRDGTTLFDVALTKIDIESISCQNILDELGQQ